MLTGTFADTGFTVATGASHNVDITVTGAAVNDAAFVNPPGNFLAGLIVDAVFVQATNIVRARVTNRSAGSIDMPAGSWRATAVKF